MKSGRTYRELSKWQRALFELTTWSTFKNGDFEDADDSLYVAYVVSDVDVDEYRGDIFIFPAREFGTIVAAAPQTRDGRRQVHIARLRDDANRWVLWRQRTTFDSVTDETCLDVSRYRRNFAILQAP